MTKGEARTQMSPGMVLGGEEDHRQRRALAVAGVVVLPGVAVAPEVTSARSRSTWLPGVLLYSRPGC